MATSDVPGANRANQDELAAGCWAEHDDGSLILVNAVSDDRVIFEIFDPAGKAGESVRDEYPVEQFKVDFSWPANGDKWVWHDKTPFPYERIMTDRSKADTAARRLMQRHQIEATPEPTRTGNRYSVGGMIQRIQEAISKARP